MRRATICALAVTILAASTGFGAEGKPRLAVLEFGHKALEAHWSRAGEAAQDMFITELVQSGKSTVIARARRDALMASAALTRIPRGPMGSTSL